MQGSLNQFTQRLEREGVRGVARYLMLINNELVEIKRILQKQSGTPVVEPEVPVQPSVEKPSKEEPKQVGQAEKTVQIKVKK
jgi:hypothetical protein